MSFLKIETERSDAGTSNVHSSDTAFVNTKTIHDANFYKDVIKGLQAELSKVKAENEQLRETVLAYSINLPQVSRKLNTLVACLEAKSYKFNRLKKQRTEDAEESHFSEESSLNDVDDGECELQDEASEEEISQTIETATSDRVRHSVQNFVEVICEEDNSVEDGIGTNGDVNDGVVDPGNRKFHSREKKENSVESTLDTSVATARTLTSRTRKLKNLKEKPMSKFKHVREGIIKKNTKQKKPVVRDDIRIQEQVQEFNAIPSEELNASLEELHVDKLDTKIKLEESLEERAMTENVACENIKLSKLRRALQESVISTASNQGANENTSNATTDNSRRGRRRAYDCEVCGRTFARSSNLAHHVMRHRNERPHRCEICDRAFVQKANLKVHLRSHTGERPFSCTECGRAFAQKNNALRHLRAHARQRQLQEQKLVCPICGKTFGRWPSYETHMRRSHSSLESNANGPVTHCMVQGMVNDSHPANISPSVGGISGGSPHPSVSVSHHVENSMTDSQLPLEPSTLESVLPSTVALVSVHASDSINNGHISQGHHPQNEHVLVGAHVTITAQLNGSHSCTDSNC